MTKEFIPIDISDSPDLQRLAEEVEQSGTGRLLVRGDQTLAIVQPLLTSERGSRRRRIADPKDDPLLGIIGILDEGDPTDIARFKDQYIADAADRRGA